MTPSQKERAEREVNGEGLDNKKGGRRRKEGKEEKTGGKEET